MADVFISYSSEDRNRVRPLAEALQARGFNIWWDRALAAGQDYSSVIDRELRGAKAVIVVWTASSAASTFVRDEAGRARDEGRLIPVLLDRVDIPLGFGAFQAEDFTRWNGGRDAPQMQLLEESLKAKLSGREVDGDAVARKRRKLMSRIRIVSLLTVVALVIGIAAFGKYIFFPDEPEVVQADLRGELLRLLAEGKLTPEQAIQLAQILEAGALGEEQQMAANDQAPSSAAPAPMSGEGSSRVGEGGTQLASVSEQEFNAAASETWTDAFRQLSRHPDESVRIAVGQMAVPTQRDAAMQTLWAYAQSHPDDPLREEIYLLCGAVGERNADPLGQRALEIATTLQPRDGRSWRMLSRSYRRTDRGGEAAGAALVSEAVDSQAQGNEQVAEQQLQQALTQLEAPAARSVVAAELGGIAERRGDWSSAGARYGEAARLGEQAAEEAPATSPIVQSFELNVQRQVNALDRSGRTREACAELREAQAEHNVETPDQELAARCQRQFNVRLRDASRVPREQLQRAPVQQQTTP